MRRPGGRPVKHQHRSFDPAPLTAPGPTGALARYSAGIDLLREEGGWPALTFRGGALSAFQASGGGSSRPLDGRAAYIRSPPVDYESHAIAVDRIGLEVLVVAAGLGPGAAQALIAGGVKLG